MITITAGAATSNPVLVLPYDVERPIRNTFFEVPDREEVEVQVYAAGLRTGELQIFFTNLADAMECFDMHTIDAPAATPITYVDSIVPAMNMSYFPRETARLTQTEAIKPWIVTVRFQEVAP